MKLNNNKNQNKILLQIQKMKTQKILKGQVRRNKVVKMWKVMILKLSKKRKKGIRANSQEEKLIKVRVQKQPVKLEVQEERMEVKVKKINKITPNRKAVKIMNQNLLQKNENPRPLKLNQKRVYKKIILKRKMKKLR